jgi:hypothetical protein
MSLEKSIFVTGYFPYIENIHEYIYRGRTCMKIGILNSYSSKNRIAVKGLISSLLICLCNFLKLNCKAKILPPKRSFLLFCSYSFFFVQNILVPIERTHIPKISLSRGVPMGSCVGRYDPCF